MKTNLFAKTYSFISSLLVLIVGNFSFAQADDCVDAIVIAPGTYSGTTLGATADVAPFCGTADGTGGGVWYQVTGTNNCGVFTASLCSGTTFDTKIRVYDGACGALNCIGGSDDFCGVQSEYTWNYVAGTTYYILVHGSSAEEGNFELVLSESSTDVINPVPNTPYTAGPVDQSGLVNTTYMAAFSQTDLAQSFIPLQNSICGGAIFTQAGGGNGDITIALYNNLPNAGGVMLASGTAINASSGVWVEALWPPTSVTPGSTYYLVFTSTNLSMGIAGDVSNNYPGGMVFANPGYNAFSGFDYAFQTFYGCTASLPTINSTCPVTSLAIPTANDNCAGVINGTSDAVFPISTNTTVIWTYDDGNGNITTETQQVNAAADLVDPVPNNATLSDIIENCSSNPVPPTANDNCSGTIDGVSDIALPISVAGTYVITWTYDDGNGNVVTQTQNVTVVDDTDPVPALSTLPDIAENCSSNPPAPTATDNCAGVITATPDVTLPITTNGLTVVTWTYDDGNGNIVSQTQNITVTTVDAGVTQTGATLTANSSTATYVWLDCNDSYAEIPGATSQTYVPTSITGSYAVEVTEFGCVDTSACFIVDYTSISEIQNEISFAVYPNPSNTNLNLTVNGLKEDNFVLNIIDVQGKVVFTKTYNQVNGQLIENIVITQFENGVYLLELKNDEGVLVSTRVVKF